MDTGMSLWSMSHDSCVLQMCAPYSALQSYKLKVKMTPGSQRKGRAARQVRLGQLDLQLSHHCAQTSKLMSCIQSL